MIDKYKSRQRMYYLQYQHGLTIEDYNGILAHQNNGCAICSESKELVVDHCHDKQYVRGLLCQRCNIGLGYFYDKPELVRTALDYLINPSTKKLGIVAAAKPRMEKKNWKIPPSPKDWGLKDCLCCDTKIPNKANRKYCSFKCQSKVAAVKRFPPKDPIHCPVCSVIFTPLQNQHKCCSRKCWLENHRHPHQLQYTCQHCSSRYKPYRYSQKFCSSQCCSQSREILRLAKQSRQETP